VSTISESAEPHNPDHYLIKGYRTKEMDVWSYGRTNHQEDIKFLLGIGTMNDLSNHEVAAQAP
jgi:hypothetical protein